jgi:DNA invertase Pin-like site-specific DNA recombinase
MTREDAVRTNGGTPSGTKRAVIYLRVSTNDQLKTDYDADGFSIRAQREACERKAGELGAVVVEEFVDRGESARSADRPDLQRMLTYLRSTGGIDFVIVHKVDRLARSREDDMAIVVAIRQANAKLVSATENIDETPQGKLLHGIMATIAEFYSANLATEARKGMRHKAMSGGTVSMAPMGYLNARERLDGGKEVRTVVLDPERAQHVQWIFEAYASGNWSMREIADELNRRGLRKRGTRGGLAGIPIPVSYVEVILKNPYYTGVVVFDGVEYPGRHHALVDHETFEQVQASGPHERCRARRSTSIRTT